MFSRHQRCRNHLPICFPALDSSFYAQGCALRWPLEYQPKFQGSNKHREEINSALRWPSESLSSGPCSRKVIKTGRRAIGHMPSGSLRSSLLEVSQKQLPFSSFAKAAGKCSFLAEHVETPSNIGRYKRDGYGSDNQQPLLCVIIPLPDTHRNADNR